MNEVLKDNNVHCPVCRDGESFLKGKPRLLKTVMYEEQGNFNLRILFECSHGHKWEILFTTYPDNIWVGEHTLYPREF